MTAHVERERWRICKARLRKALAGAVGAVVLLALFQFVKAHFFWHVEAKLLPPLQEWPEEFQRQAAAFREARGDLKVRAQIERVWPDVGFDWYDNGECVYGTSEDRVSYWDVLFRKRPVWTTKDILAAYGPNDTISYSYWDDWKVHLGYDWIGRELSDPSQIIFHFDHGVLTGVGFGHVGWTHPPSTSD